MEFIEHNEMVQILGYTPNERARAMIGKARLNDRYIYLKSDVMGVKYRRNIKTLKSALGIILADE